MSDGQQTPVVSQLLQPPALSQASHSGIPLPDHILDTKGCFFKKQNKTRFYERDILINRHFFFNGLVKSAFPSIICSVCFLPFVG